MNKNILKISKNDTDNSVNVIIEKDFSINNISQIKTELTPIVEKNSKITLELVDIENFDLTAIQLLHSLRKNKDKTITIKAKIKDDLKNIVINSGFNELIK